MPRTRLFLEWLATLVFALLAIWWAAGSGATARLDNQLLDLASSRAASLPSPDLAIVAIDDRSLQAIGQWPWDRRRVAQLVDRLTEAGAKAVVLDIIYAEPSDPEADAVLVEALARSGKVALPYGFTAPANRTSGVDPLPVLPDFAKAALATGHAVVEADGDGLVRRVTLDFVDGERGWPHILVELHRQLGARGGRLGGGVLPLRPAGSYAVAPASAVLAGEVPESALRGKIVLVGATAPGLGDTFPVSEAAGSAMSGVELQANLLQAIIENRFVRPFGPAVSMAIGALALVILFLGFWRLRPMACLLLGLLLIGLLILGAYFATLWQLRWFAPFPAIVALVVAYPLWGWRRLAAVSAFLGQKAARLAPLGAQPGVDGFDTVARESSRLGFLVDQLAERHGFLQQVIETSPEAICAFDGDGGLVLVNRRAEALFTSTQLGQTLDQLVAASGARFADGGKELSFPNGEHYTLARSAPPESGTLEGLSVVAFADISEMRRAEAERRDMLGFLSHDMRSPQVAILGLVASGKSEGEKPERLERIEKHARRTLTLAENFIQIARLAEVPLDLEDVDLGALASEAIDRAWHASSEKGISVSVDQESDIAFVRADPTVISRAIDNLLGNAIRYSPAGSAVGIAIKAPSPGYWTVAVSDNGPGLPESRLAQPFSRFGARDGKEGGAGLGLAFVEAAVRKHGGEIRCLSGPSGTRFEFDLAASSDP